MNATTEDELKVLSAMNVMTPKDREGVNSHVLAKEMHQAEPQVTIMLFGLAQLGLVKYLRNAPLENKTFGVWSITPMGEQLQRLIAETPS